MITEEQKFRAETLRILGIALITPFAGFILDPYIFFKEHNVIYTILYVISAIISAGFGITQIEIARSILYRRGIQEWKYQKQK